MRIISEAEFAERIRATLSLACDTELNACGWVTGPGRSGAIAAVYASHILHIPFVPYGSAAPDLGRVLLIDTARESGATLRKAERRYEASRPVVRVCFEEPPRVAFWYEAPKPQRYRHEQRDSFPPVPPWPATPMHANNAKRAGWKAFFDGKPRDPHPFPPARLDLQAGFREGWDRATNLGKSA